MAKQTVPPLPLPKGWPQKVRSAAVHTIALARLALTTARGQAGETSQLADSPKLPPFSQASAASLPPPPLG